MIAEFTKSSINLKKITLAFVSVAITIAALWIAHGQPDIKETTWEDVQVEAQKGAYKLINTDELKDLLQNESANILLVDTRQEWEHRTGHIPGSINFPITPTWWSRITSSLALEKALGKDKNRKVVFY